LRDVPWAAFQYVGGELDVGGGAACAALCHYIPSAAFTLTALGGNAKLELDLVKAQARTGMAGNFSVGDSAADANDHGLAWLVIDVNRCADYKCESVAFAMRERQFNKRPVVRKGFLT
jgi:hypothetical protein